MIWRENELNPQTQLRCYPKAEIRQCADRINARPAKAGEGGPGLATTHRGGRGRVMTKRGATLNERTRTYSRQTQRSAFLLRLPSFGTVQSPDLTKGKQALWRATPPILRTQSRSRRG